jgi:hypothetical protein
MSAVHNPTVYRDLFLKTLARITREREHSEPDDVTHPVTVDEIRCEVELVLPGRPGRDRDAVGHLIEWRYVRRAPGAGDRLIITELGADAAALTP